MQRFSPMVSSRHFTVLGFTFRFAVCSGRFCTQCEVKSCLTLRIFPVVPCSILLLCTDTSDSFVFHVRQNGSGIALLYPTLPHTPYMKIFLLFVFCAFLFLRVKIQRDFVTMEYSFVSLYCYLACFPYIFDNTWYYLTLIFYFYLFYADLDNVKGSLIVLFLFLQLLGCLSISSHTC